jgi:hypothetical protein
VPSKFRPLMNVGKVLVTNWHAFAPESEHKEGDRTYAVVCPPAAGEQPILFENSVPSSFVWGLSLTSCDLVSCPTRHGVPPDDIPGARAPALFSEFGRASVARSVGIRMTIATRSLVL